ncbi:MAG: F0F1 ATP synthase subunit delta, partial [Gammaproteobacteria bacterium]
MRNLSIARPYAQSAFEYARDKQELSAWKAFLASAASVVQHPDVIRLLQNPDIQPAERVAFFEAVLASQVNTERKNFLRLLAEHERFIVLPEISTLFNAYEAELEKISTIRVVTAVEIADDYRETLAQQWKKRLHR